MAGPFDLARFAPNPIAEFKLRNGTVYRIVADPDVDYMARMLRIESVLRGQDEDANLGETMVEGKQVLCDLIRQVDPDVDLTGFKVSAQEMLVLFSLILRGQSVAEAVLEAISGGNAADAVAAEEPGSQNAVEASEDEPGGDVAPLPSVKRSPEPSSDSAEADAGLQATGTA